MGILEETRDVLIAGGYHRGRQIRDLFTDNYFTVVGLDDGNVGAAMSYYHQPPWVRHLIEGYLKSLIRQEPLLLGFLFSDENDHPVGFALRNAVLSALSHTVLERGDGSFRIHGEPPFDILAGKRVVTVIGFGGYMSACIQHPDVVKIHIVDRGYLDRREEMELFLAEARRNHPGKQIEISLGDDLGPRISQSDATMITGSALSNGTMESLLILAADCPLTVVQGQSAGIHPGPFFRRGVDLVVTTLKPAHLVDYARKGQLAELLENARLPKIYLVPG